MRNRRFIAVGAAAAAAVVFGAVAPAFANPVDDLLAGDSTHQGRVDQLLGYVLDLAEVTVVGDADPIAAVNSRYGPVGKMIAKNQKSAADDLVGAFVEVDVNTSKTFALLDKAVASVNKQCGSCAPGLGGGPIGPVPVGPIGDEAFILLNGAIGTVNQAYYDVGAIVNGACGNCAPGLGGGPIGPVPVGPIGNPGDA